MRNGMDRWMDKQEGWMNGWIYGGWTEGCMDKKMD